VSAGICYGLSLNLGLLCRADNSTMDLAKAKIRMRRPPGSHSDARSGSACVA